MRVIHSAGPWQSFERRKSSISRGWSIISLRYFCYNLERYRSYRQVLSSSPSVLSAVRSLRKRAKTKFRRFANQTTLSRDERLDIYFCRVLNNRAHHQRLALARRCGHRSRKKLLEAMSSTLKVGPVVVWNLATPKVANPGSVQSK